MSRKSYNVVSIINNQTSSSKMKSRIWKFWAAARKTQIFAPLRGADYLKLCESHLKLNSLCILIIFCDYIEFLLSFLPTQAESILDLAINSYFHPGVKVLVDHTRKFIGMDRCIQNPVKHLRWSILQK